MRRFNPPKSLVFATLLTLAGGLQDTYSYALRGHVFVNALTGNVVLMALSLVEGHYLLMARYLRQILAFALGVYLSGRLSFTRRRGFSSFWREAILLMEILTLIFVGFLPSSYDSLANGLMAFSCGMQVNTFREFQNINFATTMCVGNVRTMMHHLAAFHHTKNGSHQKVSRTVSYIVFVFFTGAMLGGLVFPYLALKSIWLSAFFLFLAFIALNTDKHTAH